MVWMLKDDLPQEIFARFPSTEKSITADGKDLVMSANKRPGIKTVPVSITSAFKFARALVSASLPERIRPDLSAVKCMPVKSGCVDLVGKVREAHSTASAITSRSTWNFTYNSPSGVSIS